MSWNRYIASGVPNGLRTVYSSDETTQPAPQGTITKVTAAPRRLQFDLTTFLIGTVAGGIVALLFIYGVAPAAFQYGAAKIREKTPR